MKFYESNPKRMKRAIRAGLIEAPIRNFAAQPIPPAKTYELFDFNELNHGGHRTLVFDVESYPNYFCVSFKCVVSAKIITLENNDFGHFINGFPVTVDQWTTQLIYILYRFTVVGFNSVDYDMPVCMVASQGVDAPMLHHVTDEIINHDMPPWEVERKYCGKIPAFNHIDLIEVLPLQGSLKLYAARLHCERIQDLPFQPFTILEPWQQQVVRDYNINDLDNTQLLWEDLKLQIKLRIELGRMYSVDLRSKSDAQIAETVIVSELEKLNVNTKALELDEADRTFYYRVPDFIEFKTTQFQHVLSVVRSTPWIIGDNGYADCPQQIEALKPKLGKATYRLGAGGLHSSEESVCYQADEYTLLIDRDVASYYPYIILNQGLSPKHLGEPFLRVYRNIVNRRVNAKREDNKVEADSLKITINGTFGKLGNQFSKIYSPDLLIQVTMTGQLSLLMLIEMVSLAGFIVASANTDGIVIICPKDGYKLLEQVIIVWEEKTGFLTEETRYKMLAARDVNNYIAVKEEGGCKTKGAYSEFGSALNSPLSKNPDAYICSLAVQQLLENGVSIEDTISNCLDLTKFLCVRNVKGGAEKDGVYLGKVVRWYYAKEQQGEINYVISGNKVAKTEGGKPCMILPDSFPDDIDFDRYINEATEMLYDIGVLRKAQTERLFNG